MVKLNISCNMNIIYNKVIAISEPLTYVESFNGGKYDIFSDSKSALQHLALCSSKIQEALIAYIIMRSIQNLESV